MNIDYSMKSFDKHDMTLYKQSEYPILKSLLQYLVIQIALVNKQKGVNKK